MITIYLKQYNKIIRNADTSLFDESVSYTHLTLPTKLEV